MGKKRSKRKNHKHFNPIRNVEKLQGLGPKLRELESDNNGRNPKASSSPSDEKEKQIFSEKDREMILHVRKLFAKNGKMPEYHEELNAIIIAINGYISIHPLFLIYEKNIFTFVSVKGLNAFNSSEEFLKHLLNLNLNLPMGCFTYSSKKKMFLFKLSIPLQEKPTKKFIEDLIAYIVNILDDHLPELILQTDETRHWKNEGRNPTFH